MIWNPEIETLPRDQLNALQLERLRATVSRVLTADTPMRDRLRAAGIGAADDVASLADLCRLPFTVKSDLREHYPFGLLAVPARRLRRIHASSGTRGKPTVAGYTQADLAVWSEVMARCLAMAGVEPGMVSTTPSGTDCSPAVSVSTRGPSCSAARSCRFRAA
jgi:phenylacetate-CoA ligase